jgi:hypothetical protein
MAGNGIRSFAKLRRKMSRIATRGITPWQTALKWTADCQAPRSDCQEYCTCGQVRPVAIRSEIDTFVCGNPQYAYSIRGNSRSKRRGLPQSEVHILERSLKGQSHEKVGEMGAQGDSLGPN